MMHFIIQHYKYMKALEINLNRWKLKLVQMAMMSTTLNEYVTGLKNLKIYYLLQLMEEPEPEA